MQMLRHLLIWLIGAALMTVPAVLFTWGFIELSRFVLLLILVGMAAWVGAMGNTYRFPSQQPADPTALPNTLILRALALAATAGACSSALAFTFPVRANLLILFVLLGGGQPAFLSLLFRLREIDRPGTRGRPPVPARA